MLQRFEAVHHATPASLAQVLAFTNGAVGCRLPGNNTRKQALCNDPVTNLSLEIATNPVLGKSQSTIALGLHASPASQTGTLPDSGRNNLPERDIIE